MLKILIAVIKTAICIFVTLTITLWMLKHFNVPVATIPHLTWLAFCITTTVSMFTGWCWGNAYGKAKAKCTRTHLDNCRQCRNYGNCGNTTTGKTPCGGYYMNY